MAEPSELLHTNSCVSVYLFWLELSLWAREEGGLQAGGMGPTVVEERAGVARTAATCSSRAPHPDQPPAQSQNWYSLPCKYPTWAALPCWLAA